MNFTSVFKQQISMLFKRKAFYIAFAVFWGFCMFAAISVIINELGTSFWGKEIPRDFGYILAAAQKYILNPLFTNSFTSISAAMLVSVFAFADSYFSEQRTGLVQIIFAKTKRSYYYASKLIVTYIGNIIIFAIPLIANQIALLSFYRVNSLAGYGGTEGIYTYNHWLQLHMTFSPRFYMYHPYIYNILYAFLFAAFMGLIACVALCLSYYIKKYRIAVLAFPFVFFVISNLLDTLLEPLIGTFIGNVKTVWFGLDNYLVTLSNGFKDSPWFFFLLCGAMLAFIIVSTGIQCRRDALG